METRELFDRLVADHGPATMMKYQYALSLWDQRHNLPSGAGNARDQQNGRLAGQAHHLYITSPIGDTLDALEACADIAETLTSWERAFVARCRRSWNRAVHVPVTLRGDLGTATSEAKRAQSAANAAQDWSIVAPSIQRVIDLKRQEAALYLDSMGISPDDPDALYAALFEEHEPGFPMAALRSVLDEVRSVGPAYAAYARGITDDAPSLLNVHVDAQELKKVLLRLPHMFGFDTNRGRSDFATNPCLTNVGPDDPRISMNSDPTKWGYSVFTAMHELGHGIGVQATPDTTRRCDAVEWLMSAGISEMSAMLWDMYVGRSREYLSFFYPTLRSAFPHLAGTSLDTFFRDLNMPRLKATTFIGTPLLGNLSLALQTQEAMGIVAGRITAADIPEAYEAAYLQFFGVPQHDGLRKLLRAEHYGLGYFGYIPTYLLANLAAAALVQAYQASNSTWALQWSEGDVSGLRHWLTEHVYPWNGVYNIHELLMQVTGDGLKTAAWQKVVSNLYPQLSASR